MSDEKRRSKRQSHVPTEEGWWDCSMCTYKNPPEFFKCEMCECRKGTSTRKPRVTTQITAQQVAQSVFTPPPPKKERKERKLERKSDRLSVDAATPVDTEFAQDDSVEGDREEPDLPDVQPEIHVPPPSAPIIKVKKDSPQVDTTTMSTPVAPVSTKPKKEPSTSKDKTEKDGIHSTKVHRRRPPRLKNIDRSSGQSMEVTVNNVTVIITDYKPKRDKSSAAAAAASSGTASSNNNTDNNHHISSSGKSMNNITSSSNTQSPLSERDGGESKDSFCSSIHTDTTALSGGEAESVHGEVTSSTMVES